METQALIRQRVRDYFITGENNCAMTVLKVLAELFDVSLEGQVVDAAQAMPGAGGVDGLCGLLSGALMFLGVWGGQQGLPRAQLRPISTRFMVGAQEHFGSRMCSDLRGECGQLAVDVLSYAVPVLQEGMARVG